MQMERYAKQIKFKHISEEDQQHLSTKKVAIIGLGGLGSMEAQLLARAGVGTLVLVDPDYVELDNLHRQLLYDEGDVDKLKAVVAKERLSKINSSCRYIAHVTPITRDNVAEILSDVDLVVDGLDDMQTRYVLNDYCMRAGKPFVHAAVAGSIGVVFNIIPQKGGACLQCLYPKELVEKELQTYSVDVAGALNMAVATVASIAACEALKILLNKDVSEDLIYIDLWKEEFQKIKVEKDVNCPTCRGIYTFLEGSSAMPYHKLGRNKFFVFGRMGGFDFESFVKSLSKAGYAVRHDEYVAHVADSGARVSFLRNGDAIIKGVTSGEDAIKLYSKLMEMAERAKRNIAESPRENAESEGRDLAEKRDAMDEHGKPFLPESRTGEDEDKEEKGDAEGPATVRRTTLFDTQTAENVEKEGKTRQEKEREEEEDDSDLFFPNPFQ